MGRARYIAERSLAGYECLRIYCKKYKRYLVNIVTRSQFREKFLENGDLIQS